MDRYYLNAYALAKQRGFKGTVDEWLASLKGATGDTGAPGRDFTILGYYADLAALMAAVPDPMAGDAYGIGTEPPYDICIWDGASAAWLNNGPMKGDKGDIGPVGPEGAAATIEIGATETGEPGTAASVTNSGTAGAAIFNFTIPSGLRGMDGADGPPGRDGIDGTDGKDGKDGADGEKGDTGAGFAVLDYYPTYAALAARWRRRWRGWIICPRRKKARQTA